MGNYLFFETGFPCDPNWFQTHSVAEAEADSEPLMLLSPAPKLAPTMPSLQD